MRLPPSLVVEDWPLDRLRLDGRNPRTHPPAQVRQVAESIRRFGWTSPILAAPDGTVIAGEARLEAARQLRRPSVPVIVLGGLSEVELRAYRVADNRLPLGAAWDERLLAEVLAELQAAEFDLPALGFSDDELAALFAGLAAPAPEDPPPERIAPPPAEPVTRLGDVWQLGPHRLICGDSTRPETLARLMDGSADMVFTDPPYGMSFGKGKEAGSTAKGAVVKAHGMILGDDAQGDELVSLVGQALQRAAEWARPGAAFYVCFTWHSWDEFARALTEARLAPSACIVWDKGSIGLGFQHYRPRHEFIFYCRGTRWYGGRTEGDVWSFSRGRTEDYVHPTQKPVELVAQALENSSLPGDVVLDLFGGSGTTLIAAERTGRVARLVELDPKYCDVIARRWESATGKVAERAGPAR